MPMNEPVEIGRAIQQRLWELNKEFCDAFPGDDLHGNVTIGVCTGLDDEGLGVWVWWKWGRIDWQDTTTPLITPEEDEKLLAFFRERNIPVRIQEPLPQSEAIGAADG